MGWGRGLRSRPRVCAQLSLHQFPQNETIWGLGWGVNRTQFPANPFLMKAPFPTVVRLQRGLYSEEGIVNTVQPYPSRVQRH